MLFSEMFMTSAALFALFAEQRFKNSEIFVKKEKIPSHFGE